VVGCSLVNVQIVPTLRCSYLADLPDDVKVARWSVASARWHFRQAGPLTRTRTRPFSIQKIPRKIPHTNPTPPDESDTTGQVFFQIRMIPTPPDHSDRLQPPHNPSVVGSIPTGPTKPYQLVLPTPLSGALKQTTHPKWTRSLWSYHPTDLDKDAGPNGGGYLSPSARRSGQHGCNLTRAFRGRELIAVTRLTAQNARALYLFSRLNRCWRCGCDIACYVMRHLASNIVWRRLFLS
jgi:hypothetical protein